MTTIQKLPVYAFLLATTLFPAFGTAGESAKKWDATVAQALSDELISAAQRLVVECRNAPPNYQDVAGGEHLEFRYHARHMRSVAVNISTLIEHGGGRVETTPLYRESMDILDDLKRYAAGNPRGAWSKVEKSVLSIEEILQNLGAFYI